MLSRVLADECHNEFNYVYDNQINSATSRNGKYVDVYQINTIKQCVSFLYANLMLKNALMVNLISWL